MIIGGLVPLYSSIDQSPRKNFNSCYQCCIPTTTGSITEIFIIYIQTGDIVNVTSFESLNGTIFTYTFQTRMITGNFILRNCCKTVF